MDREADACPLLDGDESALKAALLHLGLETFGNNGQRSLAKLLRVLECAISFLNDAALPKPCWYAHEARKRLVWPVMHGVHEGQREEVEALFSQIQLSKGSPIRMSRKAGSRGSQWMWNSPRNRVAREFLQEAWREAQVREALAKQGINLCPLNGPKKAASKKAAKHLSPEQQKRLGFGLKLAEHKLILPLWSKKNAGKWAYHVYHWKLGTLRQMKLFPERSAAEIKALEDKLTTLSGPRGDPADGVKNLTEIFRGWAG
jgi:hypothetical protein